MQSIKYGFLAFTLVFILISCGQKNAGEEDTLSKGNIEVSVDATYMPIVEEQLKVFDSSYPEAHIKVSYKPESECIQDLFQKKPRVILVTRELSAEEIKAFEEKKIVTHSLAIAKDAIAVIVHPASSDSTFTIAQLKDILAGRSEKKITVVFDDEKSSTVRYISDSLLQGIKLGENVFAAKSNEEVVNYVADHPGSIGFLGVSYISDIRDDETQSFLEKVKVAYIKNDKNGIYSLPYQARIASGLYPLTRYLYYISRENYPGLGTGFVNFLSRERGQLIFLHSGLFPLRQDVIIRDAQINK